MSAGSGDLSTLANSIKTIGFTNGLQSNNTNNIKSVLKTLFNINKKMFEIGNITKCSNITRQCVSLTHNDIKTQNMIYTLMPPTTTLNKDYNIEYIDYGGFIFSNTFFTSIKIKTPSMENLVYSNLYTGIASPASPLYDICSSIYTMFLLLTDSSGKMVADYSYYNFDLLKRLYSADILSDIYLEYNVSIYQKFITNLNKNIFNNTLTQPIISNDKNIQKYFNILCQYLNLAMCIYRYHFKNIPKSLHNYESIQFKDFEILELDEDVNPIKFVKIGEGKTNNDLLEEIITYVKGKISIIEFN